MCPAAPTSLFLSRRLFLFFCLHMEFFFSFSVWGCFVLFSSPHYCMPPTCCLFAVWCPGWSWMASISTYLKQRTSRPTTCVQRGQVCSVTLKPSSLATRRTCVASFLSTPTLSVEGGKLGGWRNSRVLPLMLERFYVTPAQSTGLELLLRSALMLGCGQLLLLLLLKIWFWPEEASPAAVKGLRLILLTIKSVFCSCKLVLMLTGLLNWDWLIRQTLLLSKFHFFPSVKVRVARLF